jgi:hypothetical protein
MGCRKHARFATSSILSHALIIDGLQKTHRYRVVAKTIARMHSGPESKHCVCAMVTRLV